MKVLHVIEKIYIPKIEFSSESEIKKPKKTRTRCDRNMLIFPFDCNLGHSIL